MKFPRGWLNPSRLKLLLLVVVCAWFFMTMQSDSNICEVDMDERLELPWTRNVTVTTKYAAQHPGTKEVNQSVEVDIKRDKLQTEDGGNVMNFSETFVLPTTRRAKGFLTIGIPTIKRKNVSYLPQTISSLLSNMSPMEREEVLIVIFLADTDPVIKQILAEEINATFYDVVSSGLIQIIQAPESYYPHLDISKNLYRQSKIYMMWRVKQCYDYAYLLEYSIGLSTYYMQLEDDVVAAPDYIKSIKQFMGEEDKKKHTPWVCLEFSELGFIGKLYRSSDLKKLTDLLKLFSSEQPVDYIYTYFNLMNSQMSQRLRVPTLFQHIGIKSSSPRNIQRLKDRFYDERLNNQSADERFNNQSADERLNNPSADVHSSCRSFMTYYPRLAYNGEIPDGYFWTNNVLRTECILTVVFNQPQLIRHVTVESGTYFHQEDRIHKGKVLVGFMTRKHNGKEMCVDTEVIGVFDKKGRVDVDIKGKEMEKKAVCLLVVAAKQKSWLIVRSIVVKVSDSTIS